MKEIKNIKVRSDMYYDTKFKIIDTKPLRDIIHYVWMRALILAGIVNREGELYLSRNIPYTIETLAIEFNRDVEVVKMALDVLIELEMIGIIEYNVYKVKNFIKYQNIKTKEKHAVEAKREEIENKNETESLELNNTEDSVETNVESIENSNENTNIEIVSIGEKSKEFNIPKESSVKSQNFIFKDIGENNKSSSKSKNLKEQDKKANIPKGRYNSKGKRGRKILSMEDDDKSLVKLSNELEFREGYEVVMNWSF